MSAFKTSSEAPSNNQRINFAAEETTEVLTKENRRIVELRDLDNLPEGTRTSTFPQDLPPRQISKYRDREEPLSHKHAVFTTHDMEACPRPRWFLNHRSMKVTDLASLTIQFSERKAEKMIPLQQQTIEKFKKSKVNIDSEGVSDVDLLSHYGTFFDDFFFFGSLSRLIRLRIQKDCKNACGTCTENAYCVGQAPSSHSVDRTKCDIDIPISTEPDRKIRLTKYLSCLLHQLVHAYMALFSCRVRLCHMNIRRLGPRSHGKAFQDVAFAVEKGVRIFGLELDLMRKTCFAGELTAPHLMHIGYYESVFRDWDFGDERELQALRTSIIASKTPMPRCYRFRLYQATLFT